jgi:hypothetical protein
MEDPFFRRFFFQETPERPRAPRPRIGSGSGFVISPDGYVLTNNHVVVNFEKIEVTLNDGRSFDARVIGADPSIDLALLKIEASEGAFPTLPLGDSDDLRVGEWVRMQRSIWGTRADRCSMPGAMSWGSTLPFAGRTSRKGSASHCRSTRPAPWWTSCGSAAKSVEATSGSA